MLRRFMEVASLVNTERRMLKAMLAKPEYSWPLEEILTDCEWHDQAVAVGAGQGLADKHLVTIRKRCVSTRAIKGRAVV